MDSGFCFNILTRPQLKKMDKFHASLVHQSQLNQLLFSVKMRTADYFDTLLLLAAARKAL